MLITLFCLFWKGFVLEIVNSCEKNNHGCSHHCECVLGQGGGGIFPATVDTSLIQMGKQA